MDWERVYDRTNPEYARDALEEIPGLLVRTKEDEVWIPVSDIMPWTGVVIRDQRKHIA